jgi:hypothetical protein
MFEIIDEINYFLYRLYIKYLYLFYNRWHILLIFLVIPLVFHYDLGYKIAISIYSGISLFRENPAVNYVPIDQRTTTVYTAYMWYWSWDSPTFCCYAPIVS